MPCRKWQVQISKQHEGELSDEEEANLSRHLESCHHCRILDARLRSVSALLNESPELPVPDFLSQRITAAVSERMRQHPEGGVWGMIKLFSYRYRAIVTTAVLVIGLCIGGLAGHNIAGLAKVGPAKLSYDLLTLGGIGAQGESVAFNAIWRGNGEGGRP
jgi:anti-sigma factor RsiW